MGGSTAHKRRSQRGRRAPNRRRRQGGDGGSTPVSEPSERVLSFDDHAISSGVGFDLMSRLGWTAGTPLGCSGASSSQLPFDAPRSEPIPIVVRRGRRGLGSQAVVLGSSEQPIGAPPLSSSPVSLPREQYISCNTGTAVFDPLRPRCKFDSTHVVASLKALHKHEKKCAANPYRVERRPSARTPAPVGTFDWLAAQVHGAEVEGSDMSSDDISDDDSILSALSFASFSSDSE